MVLKTSGKEKYLFFHQLLTQLVSLLFLFGPKLLLLLILLPGSRHMVLSLTQQVRALPATPQHTQTSNILQHVLNEHNSSTRNRETISCVDISFKKQLRLEPGLIVT